MAGGLKKGLVVRRTGLKTTGRGLRKPAGGVASNASDALDRLAAFKKTADKSRTTTNEALHNSSRIAFCIDLTASRGDVENATKRVLTNAIKSNLLRGIDVQVFVHNGNGITHINLSEDTALSEIEALSCMQSHTQIERTLGEILKINPDLVVLIGDCIDGDNSSSLNKKAAEFGSLERPIYVFYDDPNTVWQSDKAELEAIATLSGGQSYSFNKIDDVFAGIIATLAGDAAKAQWEQSNPSQEAQQILERFKASIGTLQLGYDNPQLVHGEQQKPLLGSD